MLRGDRKVFSMSPSIVANQVLSLSQKIEAQKLTGCISLEANVSGYVKYGLIQFIKGERVACDYANEQGNAAFNHMINVEYPKLSFAKGTMLLKRQDI